MTDDDLRESIDALTREVASLRDDLADVRERVDEVESANFQTRQSVEYLLTVQDRGKSAAETFGAVLQGALNRHRGAGSDASGVALTANDITTLTGCSRQHAYRVMDNLADEYDFCRVRDRQEIPNRATKPKALVVEVESDRPRIQHIVDATQ